MMGSSLVVQWTGFSVFTAVAWVQFLVRELRSRKPKKTPPKQNKQKKKPMIIVTFMERREGTIIRVMVKETNFNL